MKVISLAWPKRLSVHMRALVSGVVVAFSIRGMGVGLQFLFNVLVARMLGARDTGVFFQAIAIATIASVVSRIGLDQAIVRFTGEFESRDEWNSIHKLSVICLRIVLCTSIGAVVVIVVSAEWVALQFFQENDLALQLRIIALSVPCMAIIQVYVQLLRGVDRIALSTILESSARFFLALPLLFLLVPWIGVSGASVAYLGGLAVILPVATVIWHRVCRKAKIGISVFPMVRLLDTSFPLFCVSIMNLIMSWAGILIIGFYLDSQSVALFGAAMRTSMLVSFCLMMVNFVVAPQFSALHANGDRTTLASLARNACTLAIVFSMPIALVFLIFPEAVMGLYGSEFEAGANCFVILTLGQVFNAATGPVALLLFMTGQEKAMRNNVFVVSLLYLLLNFTLIPMGGIEGAAGANTICLVVLNAVSCVLAYRKLNILVLPIPSMLTRKKHDAAIDSTI